eukprot:6411479-Amphidinium_carterae.2
MAGASVHAQGVEALPTSKAGSCMGYPIGVELGSWTSWTSWLGRPVRVTSKARCMPCPWL